MSDNPSLQDLLEVQQHFGLPSPALVEKDWYVVKALAAIVAVDAAPFQLVFSGGTALSRAHRLIRRMSEDIDLKIISAALPTRPALRHLRDVITRALLEAGFQFDPEIPRIVNPATPAATRFIGCPMRRSRRAGESCGRKFKLRPPSGRYGDRPCNGRCVRLWQKPSRVRPRSPRSLAWRSLRRSRRNL